MRIGFAWVAATLSILGLIFWLARGGPNRSASPSASLDADGFPSLQERSGGSALPCAVPLAWRITRVDGEFGLGSVEADDALRTAIAEWEAAAGRVLFTVDAEAGFPIRFVYDGRQARGAEREGLEAQMRDIDQGLDERRAELARQSQVESMALAEQERLSRELQERVVAYNEAVRRWNDSGGAPEEVLRELSAEGDALERERLERQDREQELAAIRRRIEADRQRLVEDVAEYNRLANEIDDRFPPEAVQSGVYREAVRLREGRPVSVSREIRVYRFSDRADLVRVLAHELGHALGLGHADGSGVLMSREYGLGARTRGGPLVRSEDVEAVRELCETLRVGSTS